MTKNHTRYATRSTRRRFLHYAAGAATATVAANFAGLPAFCQSPPRPLQVISIPARPLPVLLAEQQGIFAKDGVQVFAEAAPNSDALRAALAAGRADIAHAAVDNAVAMFENSAADIVILMGGEAAAQELIAQPGIHSISELQAPFLLQQIENPGSAGRIEQAALRFDVGGQVCPHAWQRSRPVGRGSAPAGDKWSSAPACRPYALIEARAWYQPDARFDFDGFRTVLKLRAEIEDQWNGQPPAPDKYCDFSYYRQALAIIAPRAR